MSVNSLIVQGGTNVSSPIQKYFGVQKQISQEQSNALANQATMQQMQMRHQQMGMQQQQMQMRHQQMGMQQQEMKMKQAEAYGKALAPVFEQVNKAPDRQAAWDQFGKQQAMQIAQQMNIPVPPGAMDQWDQAKADAITSRFGKKQTGTYMNALTPEGQTVSSYIDERGRVMNPNTNQHEPTWIKAPSQQETAGAGGFSTGKNRKILEERTRSQGNVLKGIKGMRELQRMIADGDLQLGTSGDIVSGLNSVVSQGKQLFGITDTVMNADGSVNAKLIDEKADASGWLKRAGMKSVAHKALLFELAYVKAKAVGNDRITDKDFEFSVNMLEGGGDRDAILYNLSKQIDRTIEFHNIDEQMFERNYEKDGYRPMYLGKDGNIDDSYGKPASSTPGKKKTSSAAQSAVDELLRGSGGTY